MQFGYFTLSDNHYVDNRRGANQLIADILDEALYAEAVGAHPARPGGRGRPLRLDERQQR